MFTLIEGGEVYLPERMGSSPVLVVQEKIVHVGEFDKTILGHLPLQHDVVDASGCLVVPGFIDPHEHLIGAGGEHGR